QRPLVLLEFLLEIVEAGVLLEVGDFLAQFLQLGLAAEFVEALLKLEGERAHLAGEAPELAHHQGQILRADDDQRHHDQKNHFREADTRHHDKIAPSGDEGSAAPTALRRRAGQTFALSFSGVTSMGSLTRAPDVVWLVSTSSLSFIPFRKL